MTRTDSGRRATRGRRIHYFPDTGRLARRLAGVAGLPATGVALHRFPDGESLVRLRCGGEHESVVVRSLHRLNSKLIEVLLAADAARRAGARRATLGRR